MGMISAINVEDQIDNSHVIDHQAISIQWTATLLAEDSTGADILQNVSRRVHALSIFRVRDGTAEIVKN